MPRSRWKCWGRTRNWPSSMPAVGSTTICALVATRSKRARAKCSETSSPSACWVYRGVTKGTSSMEFDLSKPQRLLQKSARDLFARVCPAKKVRELMASDTAFDAELWSAVAEQGWLGIHLSESNGGLGLGVVDLAVVGEEMGRACFPGPFLGTVWAATLVAEADATSKYLQSLTSG